MSGVCIPQRRNDSPQDTRGTVPAGTVVFKTGSVIDHLVGANEIIPTSHGPSKSGYRLAPMSADFPTAAYFPYNPDTGFDAPVQLAIAFVLRHDPNPTILVPSIGSLSGTRSLESFAKKRPVLTPLNEGRSHAVRGSAMLVYAPALKELELAMRYGRRGSIAVVEDPSWLADRWADEIGAANLGSVPPRIHSVSRTPEHERILKAIDWAGNNGWHDAPGKRDLIRLLGELNGIGKLDKGEVVAYQLVHGRNHRYQSLLGLEKQVDKIIGRRG
ncbi:hypothetical protein [Rhodococcus sp. P1Y]|uniref:hypothetical protein n=1 Tax=Rhodococcus sp. P1Y TaxID=1302308 RepID=UPI000EAB8817|nr:hypothetical protein [Rhodococcus sp. P1Y]AYJ49014.1 hypothetical protein D8W71_12460 [Rhodococcus sp. P1Y]